MSSEIKSILELLCTRYTSQTYMWFVMWQGYFNHIFVKCVERFSKNDDIQKSIKIIFVLSSKDIFFWKLVFVSFFSAMVDILLQTGVGQIPLVRPTCSSPFEDKAFTQQTIANFQAIYRFKKKISYLLNS